MFSLSHITSKLHTHQITQALPLQPSLALIYNRSAHLTLHSRTCPLPKLRPICQPHLRHYSNTLTTFRVSSRSRNQFKLRGLPKQTLRGFEDQQSLLTAMELEGGAEADSQARGESELQSQSQIQCSSEEEKASQMGSKQEVREAVLFIGPAGYWEGIVRAIKELGLVVVGCIAEDYNGLKMEQFVPFRAIKADPQAAGFEALLCGRHPYQILELAVQLAHSQGLRYVACFHSNEPDTSVADFVAAGLGLKHNDLSRVLSRRDKAAMKDALSAAGVRHTPYVRATDPRHVAAFVETHGLPVVVKTPACASSADVSVCESVDEATACVAEIISRPSPWGHLPAAAVVEKFIEGEEYAINFMALDGRLHATDMWHYERHVSDSGAVLYLQVASVDVTACIYEALVEYAKEVCKAVGIRHGPAHVEVKDAPQGPVMVEIGARLSGGRKADLAAQMVPGWHPLKALVQEYAGKGPVQIPDSFRPTQHAVHLFFPLEILPSGAVSTDTPQATVRAIEGLTEIEALPSYHCHLLMVRPGSLVGVTRDIVSTPFFLWLMHSDQAQLKQDAKMARELFHLQLE